MSSSLQDQESPPDFHLEEAPGGGGFESAATNLLAMLQLNHSTSPPAPAPTITAGAPPNQHCTSCGNSTKKRSPTSLNEPSSKRATLLPPSAAATTPLSSPSTTLQRCHSEPVGTRIQENLGGPKVYRSLSDMLRFLNSQSPENSKASNFVPPSSNPIRRTLSETMSSDFQVAAASTPPRPPAVIPSNQSPSPSSICGEISPNSKRLNRMKESMRHMRQWCEELMRLEDEETGSQVNNAPNHSKEEEANEQHESVWVEENDGTLMIHFKCPCGKGYEILLSGNKCYYKLM